MDRNTLEALINKQLRLESIGFVVRIVKDIESVDFEDSEKVSATFNIHANNGTCFKENVELEVVDGEVDTALNGLVIFLTPDEEIEVDEVDELDDIEVDDPLDDVEGQVPNDDVEGDVE